THPIVQTDQAAALQMGYRIIRKTDHVRLLLACASVMSREKICAAKARQSGMLRAGSVLFKRSILTSC
ncbi:hypothetical protein, partial [Klebsiella pneumoniae]|uniref:hypothetical protein n=1 Tax=Klebsiella pneumoniae TaxID=573 RepID=UPI00195472FB